MTWGPGCESSIGRMTAPWVPFQSAQSWWPVPDLTVMPRLLAPYRFDNLAEELVPWLGLVYGESWFSRPRTLREGANVVSIGLATKRDSPLARRTVTCCVFIRPLSSLTQRNALG